MAVIGLNLPVARVDRRERRRHRRFAARAGAFDPLEHGLFALPLQAEVERQLEAVPGHRRRGRELRGHRVARGVHGDALHAGASAQVTVVVELEAFLAHDRPRQHAAEALHLELPFGDLIDVAEDLRGHVAEWVGADRDRLLADARVGVRLLGEHRLHPGSSVRLDRHGGIADGVAAAFHERVNAMRAHLQQPPQAVVQARSRAAFGGQRRGRDLHRVGGAARHDRAAAAIEDFPARRRDRQVAYAVHVGLVDVLFAGEDLQVPEPEEDHAEHHHRDAPEDRHPQRQLRRHGHARVARADSLDRAHGRESGLSPPVV
jgi:hypothetical protein